MTLERGVSNSDGGLTGVHLHTVPIQSILSLLLRNGGHTPQFACLCNSVDGFLCLQNYVLVLVRWIRTQRRQEPAGREQLYST